MATKKEKKAELKNTKMTSNPITANTRMSENVTTNGTRKITRSKTEAPMIVRQRPEPTREEIARQAYLIFERRGYSHGNDLEDWLQAEKELRNNL